MKRVKSVAALLAFYIGSGACAAVGKSAEVVVSGPEEIVVSGDDKKCPGRDETNQDTDVPDAPPRFLRVGNGSVLGFSSHYNNYLYEGTSPAKLKRRDCKTVFQSGFNSDPSRLSDREWLVSPILLDNGQIYSLVHNEYHGARYSESCRNRLPKGAPLWYPICIYGSITGALSKDKGKTFERVQGDLQVVAAPPSKFRTDGRWYGVHDPSNIVRSPKDNYYYFTANSPGFAEMEQGVCVFRTKDPLKEPWLAWDGGSFSLRMDNPYKPNFTGGESCKSVFAHAISGITFNKKIGKFIGVGGEEKDGVYYSVSDDLIHWSAPVQLLDSKPMYVWKNSPNPPSFYYSLIDPASSSADYGISDSSLYLYMVQWRVSFGKMQSRSRDIVRVPLKIVE